MVCEYIADIKVLLKLDADEALAGCEKQVIIVCGCVHVIYVIYIFKMHVFFIFFPILCKANEL